MSLTILHFSLFLIINLLVIIMGYALIKKQMIFGAWATFLTSIPIIYFLFNYESPVLKMLAIIATTFTSMKIITTVESYKGKELTLKFTQWLIFCIGWAGMRAEIFEKYRSASLPNAWPMIRFGASRILIGLLLITVVLKTQQLIISPNTLYVLKSGISLLSLSLILHFGILNISAGLWRLQGVNAYSLFKQPLASLSLTEFWSKRWNLAFIEMIAIAVFRPLKKRFGATSALIISLLFSGLLHELAISTPVTSGFGLPTTYFIIQLIPLLIEKHLIKKDIILFNNKFLARLWLFFWLLTPLPLLFHARFINQIIYPIINF